MSETAIPGGARCRQCGGDVQPQWRVCPMCGAAMTVTSPTVAATGRVAQPPVLPPLSAVPPSGAPPWAGNVRTARVEASQDRQWIGAGLLVLGILGMVGGAVMLFQSSTIDAMRFDSMLAYSTVGGGLLLVLVIVGLVAMAPRGGDSSAITTHVILSTTVSILIGAAMAAVIAVAAVVYMFNDCVRGCQGQPRTAPNYRPPENTTKQMAPRDAPVRAVEKPAVEKPAQQP